MDGFQTALLVLAAVLVGALLPLVVQLYSILHTLRQVLEKGARDIEEGTKTVHTVADRIDRLTSGLEKDGKLDALVSGLTGVSETVVQLRDTLKIASAVGAAVVPAVGAAVRAWRSHPAPEGSGDEDRAGAGRSGGSREAPAEVAELSKKEVAR